MNLETEQIIEDAEIYAWEMDKLFFLDVQRLMTSGSIRSMTAYAPGAQVLRGGAAARPSRRRFHGGRRTRPDGSDRGTPAAGARAPQQIG